MIDSLPADSLTPNTRTAVSDEPDSRQEAVSFSVTVRWMAILAGVLAFAYLVTFLFNSDVRIVPIMSVCALFSAAIILVRRYVTSLEAAVYLVGALIAVGMVGVAAGTTHLDLLIVIATMTLPTLFTGLHLAPRKMIPIAIFSVVAAFAAEWIDAAATWPRFDIGSILAIYWLAHALVGIMILYLLIAVFSRLDAARHAAHELARQLRLLYDTSRLFGGASSLNEILPVVARNVVGILNSESCIVFLHDPAGDELCAVAAFGVDAEDRSRMHLPPDEPSLARLVMERRAPIAIDSVADSSFVNRRVAALVSARSVVGLPIMYRDQVFGSLLVGETSRQRHFTLDEIARVQGLAQQIAVEIFNARSLQRERRQAADLAVLNHISMAVAASLDPSEVSQLIVSELNQVTGYEYVSLYVLDGPSLRLEAAIGFDSLLEEISINRGVIGKVARTGQPLVLADVGLDPDYISVDPEIRSEACAPIRFGNETLGVLNIEARPPRILGDSDLHLLVALATQIAVTLRNAQLFAQARQQARHERLVRLISSKISASIDVETVLENAVQELGRALDASRCLVRLGADPQNMPVAHEFHQPDIAPVGKDALESLPMLNQAVHERELMIDLRPHSISGGLVRSGLIAPIFIRGRVAGVLSLHQCDRTRQWTPDEVALIEDVSAQLGIAIDNARLYEEMSHALSDLSLLHNIAITVASAASLSDAVNRVVQSVHDAMQYACVALLFIDRETSELFVSAAIGYPDDFSKVRIKTGQSIMGWVAETGRPVLVPDVRIDPRYVNVGGATSIRSELAVPLIAGSEVVGVLNLESARLDAFDEADLQLLTTLSGSLATVIANLQLLDEVREANIRLRELDRIKSQFLANMSHELRTPLNSIIGFSEVLGDGLAGDLNADQREFVVNIHSSGKHLLKLINDILDLSKIHAGRLNIDRRPVTPHEVVDEAVAVVVPLIAKKRQHLVLNLPPELPRVSADVFRLKQVLINLLGNAQKFSPEGSQIAVAASCEDGFVHFSVADQGLGIKPEDHDTVFREFAQVDNSLTRAQEGTGLGLPISHRLVEMHGGRIWIESAGIPGEGSTFHFTIPVVATSEPSASASASAPAREPVASANGRRSVLIIEDDRPFANLLGLYFSQEGYRPVQQHSGASVLQIVRELRPVLISLDLMLPDRDGWSVLHELKSAPDTREIPMLIISALDLSDIDLGQEKVVYLPKPLDHHALLSALRRVNPAPQRILVVDDDPYLGELLKAMLPQSEYLVTLVGDGPGALDAIHRKLPDAVLLDLMLPGMSGFDLLELLRAAPTTHDLPVIVLTAKPLNQDEQNHLGATAQTVIKKADLTRQNLIEALRRLRLSADPNVEKRESAP